MRLFASSIFLFFCAQTALAEDIVIAFPVEAYSGDEGGTTTVWGFKVISVGNAESSRVTASESALAAVSDLNINLSATLDFTAEGLNLELSPYVAGNATTVTEYFVQLPQRIPGEKDYPGGGGGWWPPRVIWPPQNLPGGIDATSTPIPWPGGGGGWWPPRAATVADRMENDLLRSIYLNTHTLTEPLANSNAQLVIME